MFACSDGSRSIMEKKPTTNELLIMLDEMKSRSEERHQEYKERDSEIIGMLKDIKSEISLTKEQAIKTNGRVNKHDWYFKAMWWALGAAWTVILIGVPLLYKLLNWSIDVKLKSTADNVVTTLEDKYNLQIK